PVGRAQGACARSAEERRRSVAVARPPTQQRSVEPGRPSVDCATRIQATGGAYAVGMRDDLSASAERRRTGAEEGRDGRDSGCVSYGPNSDGGVVSRTLDRIERLGNALPHPVVIFLWLIGALTVASALAAAFDVAAVHPLTGTRVVAESLLSETNVRRLLVEMPVTFANFPPLGLVIVVMLGAAVAERSGLLAVVVGGLVRSAPPALLTPATFLAGLMSHHASDAAYVVLIPLAAIVYREAGRH